MDFECFVKHCKQENKCYCLHGSDFVYMCSQHIKNHFKQFPDSDHNIKSLPTKADQSKKCKKIKKLNEFLQVAEKIQQDMQNMIAKLITKALETENKLRNFFTKQAKNISKNLIFLLNQSEKCQISTPKLPNFPDNIYSNSQVKFHQFF